MSEDDDSLERTELELSKQKKAEREEQERKLKEITDEILRKRLDLGLYGDRVDLTGVAHVIYMIMAGQCDKAARMILKPKQFMLNKYRYIYHIELFNSPQIKMFFRRYDIWNRLLAQDDILIDARNAIRDSLNLDKYSPRWLFWSVVVAVNHKRLDQYTLTKNNDTIKLSKLQPRSILYLVVKKNGTVKDKILVRPNNFIRLVISTVYSYLRTGYALLDTENSIGPIRSEYTLNKK